MFRLHLFNKLFHDQIVAYGGAYFTAQQQILIPDHADIALVVFVQQKVADVHVELLRVVAAQVYMQCVFYRFSGAFLLHTSRRSFAIKANVMMAADKFRQLIIFDIKSPVLQESAEALTNGFYGKTNGERIGYRTGVGCGPPKKKRTPEIYT
jgi:hypothetical protein